MNQPVTRGAYGARVENIFAHIDPLVDAADEKIKLDIDKISKKSHIDTIDRKAVDDEGVRVELFDKNIVIDGHRLARRALFHGGAEDIDIFGIPLKSALERHDPRKVDPIIIGQKKIHGWQIVSGLCIVTFFLEGGLLGPVAPEMPTGGGQEKIKKVTKSLTMYENSNTLILCGQRAYHREVRLCF